MLHRAGILMPWDSRIKQFNSPQPFQFYPAAQGRTALSLSLFSRSSSITLFFFFHILAALLALQPWLAGHRNGALKPDIVVLATRGLGETQASPLPMSYPSSITLARPLYEPAS